MAAARPGSGTTPARPGRFRRWRRTRPFWGGLLVVLGGAEILASVWAPLPVVLHVGLQGLAGYFVPVVLLTCGVLLLVTPAQRVFYAIVAIILALVSWLTSNLGGFGVGMVLTLVGGCLALAWTVRPRVPTAPSAAPPPAAAPPSGEPAEPPSGEVTAPPSGEPAVPPSAELAAPSSGEAVPPGR
ncbi:DUF6114 domain-containing protein [Micromonospora cathayae]|uniref:DUF6114 domain-containing protein n=1 Tax=Micromonospora cathayae TaxID=3028804 RepID=A0ABY7ZMJ0_9ACTN|nr:DUF6114 domain-containing protein [Micromonospora sp. HUAS 3]WDZ83303.1 DUF6114 domain-containing protein [Micromonospora sp. HUAS 3]